MHMEKMLPKMLIAVFSLILAVVMVVTISYAWMTLSSSPIAEGMQITIGGGNTILIAADQTMVAEDGTVYHYPAKFDNKLLFGQYETYQYLSELGMLSPVSTADGIHWFFAEYYDLLDPEVQNGIVTAGTVKPVSQFTMESNLTHANPMVGDSGGYVYLDFWVVSPGSDYTLRISRGDETGGSYVLELLTPVETDQNGDGAKKSYTLTASTGDASASVRLGFLVNEDVITDASMEHYMKSSEYNHVYTKLKGMYREPGDENWTDRINRFTIYEPNGDLHPSGDNGTYQTTFPVAWNGSAATLADIRSYLTVQLTNHWKNSYTGISPEELFQTAILGKTLNSAEEAKREFYQKYLQNQLMPYVNKGDFVQNTASLYASANSAGTVTSDELHTLNLSGATTDVYITKLEKNVPQRIRMFVWLEGQDADCTNAVSALDFALSIELAGSN